MAFTWHGRDNGEVVWEQEITRYYFISDEEVIVKHEHGEHAGVRVGTRLKLNKSEAHKFYKHGYVVWHTSVWNETKAHYDRVAIPLSKGTLGKDVETRYLKQSSCSPLEVAPQRKRLDNPKES